MSNGKIIPKAMYEIYAPGLPTKGYYECPKCRDIKVRRSWCWNCKQSMVRKAPAMLGMPIDIHDLEKAQMGKIKVIKETVF